MTESRQAITALLEAHRRGDRDAFDRLIPLVYGDLRRMAHRQLRRAGSGGTLGTTGLVHEAYLKLVDQARADWAGQAHFFAVAARAMRQILIDYARERQALKRGGGQAPCTLDETSLAVEEQAAALIAIHEALEGLKTLDERLVRIVECRFFAGLSEEETAQALGMALRTVQRDWMRARAWLRREIGPSDAGGPGQ
jgi:RNA polymerase sigma factor (TIGR02999 family)